MAIRYPVESFLEMMAAEKGAAQNTIEAYRRDIEQFLEYCATDNLKKYQKMIFPILCNIWENSSAALRLLPGSYRLSASFLNFYIRKRY